jgi:monoterpene epsilon-lactone hydrolase
MVMADRKEVETASGPITAVTVLGLAEQLTNSVLRLPFHRPLDGPSGPVSNLGQNFTRHIIRSFMGYSSALPIEEFRSMERLLDGLCKVVMPPWSRFRDDVDLHEAVVGGVPGLWFRPRKVEPRATALYLHGGGYIGTSPYMYAAFVAGMVKGSHCEVFVADYRLAPEFPYPAGLHDARDVWEVLCKESGDRTMLVGGDSGGGGLATSLVQLLHRTDGRKPDGLVLISPEVDLDFEDESVTDNARHDILPWNIPVTAYLKGVDPDDGLVSAVHSDLSGYPPTLVSWGSHEMFRDSCARFADELSAAGIETRTIVGEGMYHVYPIVVPWSAAGRDVVSAIAQFVTTCEGLCAFETAELAEADLENPLQRD